MGEKKDSFRFTVQFNAGDPSHQQVAAILNEQGRRKAQFLVNAVTHYMNCPETPEAAAVPRIDRQTVEQLVREILSNMHPEPVPAVGEDMPCGDPAMAARSMPQPCWEKMASIRSWTHWPRYRSREINRWSYRAYFGIHKLPGAGLRVSRSPAPDL